MYQMAKFSFMADRRQPPPVPFVGAGDIVTTSWLTWISSGRAFSLATVTTNLVRVRRISDNAEQDFATLESGVIDRAALSSFLTSTTGRIVKFYDQTGNARHLEQATAANQAAVNLSGIGTRVTADFTASSTHTYATTGTHTIAFPLTMTAVFNVPSGGQTFWSGGGNFNNPALLAGLDAANTATVYNGTDLFASGATANAWHSVCGIIRNASATSTSGNIDIDGTGTDGNPGSETGWTSDTILVGTLATGSLLNGKFAEGGINSTDLSGTPADNLFANAQAFWGW